MSKKATNILYIEDDATLAECLMDELKENNIQVTHCATLSEALFRASIQKFDCIVTDMHLKTGTGKDLIYAIRSTYKHVNVTTPIIMVSAFFTEELIKLIGKEVSFALVKPYQLHSLISKIFDLVG